MTQYDSTAMLAASHTNIKDKFRLDGRNEVRTKLIIA